MSFVHLKTAVNLSAAKKLKDAADNSMILYEWGKRCLKVGDIPSAKLVFQKAAAKGNQKAKDELYKLRLLGY